MSEQTIRVDQFRLNKLQPNIDALNLSLISMEENGYDNKPMRDTRDKLNKLTVIDTFLKEYAYGNEEIDNTLLSDIMSMVGEANTSSRSNAPMLQATRDSLDINATAGCENFIRVYLNDEILTSTTLPPLHEPVIFKVYAPKSATEISVIVTYTDAQAQNPVYGTNYVTIENVSLFEIEGLELVVNTTVCGKDYSETLSYVVQDVSCESTTFWIGSTTERFKILDTIAESTVIGIEPNLGNDPDPEAVLDYTWVTTSTDMTSTVWYSTNTYQVEIELGDCHILVMIPVALELVNVNQYVEGTWEDMELDKHYAIIDQEMISPGAKFYNCYYFRDKTNTTYQTSRIVQFTIQQKQ